MQLEQFNRLVHGLYIGVLASEGWSDVLNQMRVLTNSEQAAFMVWDKRSNDSAIAEIASFDFPTLEDYHSNFSTIDPGKPAVERTPLGQWYIDARDLGVATIRTHDFYQLFMRSHGMGSGMCTPLMRNAETMAGLSFQTGFGRPHFQNEDAKILAPLLPHLLQATALRWRFRELSRLADLGQQVLDQVQSPVLVVDDKPNILLANRAGQHWLSRKQPVFSHQSMGKQSELGAQIEQLARQICGTKRYAPTAAGLKLESLDTEAPTYLVGLPLRFSHPIAQHWSHPTGVIVVHDLAERQTPWPQIMRQLFGLTPAEQRLLEALPAHDALHEVAATLGVTCETVRSQLKSVFQKTGMRTQARLARLIVKFSQLQ